MITLCRSLKNNTLFSFNRNNFIKTRNCCFFCQNLCLSQFQLDASPQATPEISSKTCPGGRDLAFESCSGVGIRQGPRFCRENETETSKK